MKNLKISHCEDVELRHCNQRIISLRGSVSNCVNKVANNCHCEEEEIRLGNFDINKLLKINKNNSADCTVSPDCFTSFTKTNSFNSFCGVWKKLAAFTLAEVLITLGIVGVVAALTIPNLITSYKAHRFRSQFLKSYSIVQQVFRQMEADDVSLDPASYTKAPFYKTFMKYLQAPLDCGSSWDYSFVNTKPCFPLKVQGTKPYQTMDGKSEASRNWMDDGQIALQDGTLILFENSMAGGSIKLHIDINGYVNPPNRWGYDLFTFQFIDGELRAMGDPKTKFAQADVYCDLNKSNAYNGITCAQKAKDNPDYFKDLLRQKFK